MRFVIMIAMFAAGCLRTELVPCGEQLCPAGDVCIAQELCAAPEQLSACEGRVDGDACSTRDMPGVCDRGACVASTCGNGIVDPGEACDDGNLDAGDGCRGDCRKIEQCGDAIVDDGEPCDDGNANPADGCDACSATTWRATVAGGANVLATDVAVKPRGLAVDRAGNVYASTGELVYRIGIDGVVTTVAGDGTYGYGGDGGQATSAQLRDPGAIAVDSIGNIYIADVNSFRIRRVDNAGVITTYAGTGVPGSTGDGGPALGAGIFNVMCLAIDGLGNLYFGDVSAARVRRIRPDGVITTVAGTGTNGFSGDGGPATAAELIGPWGVAVGPDGLYIADRGNHRIRRVDASGTITTIAGTGVAGFSGDGGAATSAQLSSPAAITFDLAGNLYIADLDNFRVRRVDPTGTITTFAGTAMYATGYDDGDGGPATAAKLNLITGLAVSATGVFIADGAMSGVRRVDATGTITSFAGNGHSTDFGDGLAATSAALLHPVGMALDGGDLLVADSLAHRIRRIDTAGLITTAAGSSRGFGGDGGAAITARLDEPNGVARDAQGNLYLADTTNQRVRRIDAGGTITTIAGTGTPGSTGDGGLATAAELRYPQNVAVDAQGRVYIADTFNHRIRRIDAQGVITTVVGTTAGCTGDGGPAANAQLLSPRALTFDSGGNMFIADYDCNVVRRVDAITDTITTAAGTGTAGFAGDDGPATDAQLWSPSAVGVDTNGNLYIADRNNSRIRRVDAAGTITTVAGTGAFGFAGDGGPASSAVVQGPEGLVVDPSGNLYLAGTDGVRGRIRRIDASTGTITSVVGPVDPVRMGPLERARLADPRELVRAAGLTLIAGGVSGTVQAIRAGTGSVEVVAGRYLQPANVPGSARYGSNSFGAVGGVALDVVTGRIYLSETTAHQLHVVTMVDPSNVSTWTIEPLAGAYGVSGSEDGSAASARFFSPAGLYLDEADRRLYVADTGNHSLRAIDLSQDLAGATVTTVAGVAGNRGFFGDGGPASSALLFGPEAITRCPNGDVFVADTLNHRVRRIAGATGTITTVIGDGVAASSGVGAPALAFPVEYPRGLACDALGNLFVTSATTVRMLPANDVGVVDGTGPVQTIYGVPPRVRFPEDVTRCLTGIIVVDATTVEVADSCTGLLVDLRREAL